METFTSFEELPIMLSVSEAARVMNISRSNMYDLIHSFGFPTVSVGKRYLIPKSELQKWIISHTNR